MDTGEIISLTNHEQALLDVTDKSLYSFNERNSLIQLREASTVMALNRLFSLADSNTANLLVYISEKAPHMKKVLDSLKGKTELFAKLSEEARSKLDNEEWRWLFAKDGSGMLPSLYDEAAGHFAKGGQIRVGLKTIRPDMLDSLIGLTQKSNLDALADKVIYLSNIVERIAAGQYNDRIALYYSARQICIEAMSMNNVENRRIALLNAVKSADDAIAALQQTIRYDLNKLSTIKSDKELRESTQWIAKCFSYLNDSVQISVNVYSALGENRALLATVTSYQCFVEQTLLSVPDRPPKNYLGCTLAEIMYSCSGIKGVDWRRIPTEIVNACEMIIRTERDMMEVLSEELEYEKLGGHEDEEM